jgi:polysaccharide biosynthesis transport protein
MSPGSPRRPETEEEFTDKDSTPFDWLGLFEALRKHFWLVLLLPSIGGVASWAHTRRQIPIYEARASLEIEERERIVKMDEVSTASLENAGTLNTLSATITSQSFMDYVAKLKKWDQKPGLLAELAPEERTSQAAAQRIRGTVRSVPRQGTRLLDIYVRQQDPLFAKELADDIADGVIRHQLDLRMRSSNSATDFLQQEVERIKIALEKSEIELQAYRDEHQAVSLGEGQNLVISQLNAANAQFTEAARQRVQLETDIAAIAAMKDQAPEALLQINSVSSLPGVASVQQAMAAKEAEFAALKLRYKNKHPRYIACVAEIQNLTERLRTTVQESRRMLEANYETAKANEQKFREVLKEQETKTMDLDRIAIRYNVLKREVESNKTMYESVLNRLKEVDVTKGLENNELRIHDLTQVSDQPVWPEPSKNMAASVGGGIALALGIIFLIHYLDRTVKTVPQIENHLHLPVLTTVTQEAIAAPDRIVLPKEETSQLMESFRTLRTMTTMMAPEEHRRVYLVTSALPSEGKTFCACHFAHSLASQGLRTLLIDADLRRPRVSNALFGQNHKPGLLEVLVGQATLTDAVRPIDPDSQLSVLTAGARAPNPAEVLAAGTFKDLIRTALQSYDRVVIDSAPVLAVSDTLTLAPWVQSTLMVIRWGRSPMPSVKRALQLLAASAGKPVSGVIFNHMPNVVSSYYYYYGYRKSYTHTQEVYGAE